MRTLAVKKWKKAEAKTAMTDIAASVSDAFGVEAPEIYNLKDKFPDWEQWEWCFDDVEVWTKAGPATLNINIDAKFAHMFFRFQDPQRAVCFDDGMGRLNRHSGKWNSLEVAPRFLHLWVQSIEYDFAKVAEKNPAPDEVAVYDAKKARVRDKWDSYIRDLPK